MLRFMVYSLLGVGAFSLALGALLYRAAFVTGATSDYQVRVSWFSAVGSAIRSPSWDLFLLVSGVLILAGLTFVIFFRVPRIVSAALLFLFAGIGFYFGGSLGLFFIFREFEAYHFSMDGEKLGEHWLVYETVFIWTATVATLAVMRLFMRNQPRCGQNENVHLPPCSPACTP